MNGLAIFIFHLQRKVSEVDLNLLSHLRVAFDDLFHHGALVESVAAH